MASLNLRKVPDELKWKLKLMAAGQKVGLEELCIEILLRATLPSGSATGDKTALAEKNRGSSGAAARGPLESGSLIPPEARVSEKAFTRRSGKSPIVVPKGKTLTEVLMQPGPVDSGSRTGIPGEGYLDADLPERPPAPAQKSREVPPDPAGRDLGCKVCGGLNGLHQKGCKGA